MLPLWLVMFPRGSAQRITLASHPNQQTNLQVQIISCNTSLDTGDSLSLSLRLLFLMADGSTTGSLLTTISADTIGYTMAGLTPHYARRLV